MTSTRSRPCTHTTEGGGHLAGSKVSGLPPAPGDVLAAVPQKRQGQSARRTLSHRSNLRAVVAVRRGRAIRSEMDLGSLLYAMAGLHFVGSWRFS